MTREPIRDWKGWILGWVDTESNGDKTLREFSFRIIGRYDSKRDVTTDFYGRTVGKGDVLLSMLNKN